MPAPEAIATGKFRVDPVFDAFYQGFYLLGIRQVAPGKRTTYSNEGFPPPSEHHCLNFVLEPDGRRIAIDTQDRPRVYPTALQWSHVYGKINIDPRSDAASDPRVVPIGPSFGIRVWRPLPATLRAVRLHALAGARVPKVREHYTNFGRQWRYRAPLAAYHPGPTRRDFVFFLASLWADDPDCNLARATFLRMARSTAGLAVEGGFAPRDRGDVPGFEDLTLDRRYSLRAYLDATRASAFVFNAPAVFGCLGWKLGEFLALGKAIISLPLNRSLPSPLEHGKHVHYVDGSPESIRDAIDKLRRDEPYRRGLETEARRYFEQFLQPRAVIERLISAASR